MASFDDIRVRRPNIARAFLALMAAQPERPLVIFAPRRVGKTFFLSEDLMPVARSDGLLPVYCDIWLNKSAPLEAINHALEEALDDLMVPSNAIGQIAKTAVKKVSVMGSGVDFGEAPQRRPLPDVPAFRLDALLGRVAAQFGGPILLMLDEVQALGIHPNGVELLSSLRAALTKHKGKVLAVFTGSSQADLTKLFSTAGAPMYQYAQQGDFPFLGQAYLEALAKHFSGVHPGKSLSIEALGDLFRRIGFKPALLRDIVKRMSAEGVVDPDEGFRLFINDPQQVAGWLALLERLQTHDRQVLLAIARQMPPYAKQTAEWLARNLGKALSIPRIRSSIDRLIKEKLVAKRETGYIVDDESFAQYLLKNDVQLL